MAIALAATGCATAYEQPPSRVLEQEGPFELRRIGPHVVAETLVDGDFDDVGNEGFRRLAAYIGGANRSRQEISMTAPVSQAAASEKIAMTAPVGQERAGDRYRITFLMPAKYTLETLPEPTDARIALRAEPARSVAVIRYSGSWSRARYQEHEARLRGWIAQRGLEPQGEPVWARYDPPFAPWFMRRNEIIIEVREPD
jgi:hypothetical protein